MTKQRGKAGAATTLEIRKPSPLIGDRYRLLSKLGAGGFGEVWEAEDRVGGGLVAVKLLRDPDVSTPAHVRGEVFILRLHQVPGVVRMLDEGVSDGIPYVVMERVDGTPFPGAAPPRRWPAIAGTVVALVETLVRLHAQGVVHGDLKPPNVLVGPDGKPTLLDFGVASDRRLPSLTDARYVAGTVPFIAPEILGGEPATPRSDLYSLGMLLRLALTGTVPDYGTRTFDILRAHRSKPAPALRSLMPDVPPEVAGITDLLLSIRPEQRPPSALAVLGMLRGHPATHVLEPKLHFGTDAHVEAILERLRARRPVDLVGPRRTGRSRCLEEISAALEGEGRAVVTVRPSPYPYMSIAPVIGHLDDHWSARLADLAGTVDARLRAALGEGTTIVADDVGYMDPYSIAALQRCRDAGALLRTFDEAAWRGGEGASVVRLKPLDEAALSTLFAGPERLFHLRSGAAKLLHARTDGVQARVAEELHEWVRAGIVAWDGARLAVARDMLDRVDARVQPPSLGRAYASLLEAPLARDLADVLAWLTLAWPDGTPDLLSACMNQPVWQVEAQLEELVRRGAARLRPDGAFEPLTAAHPNEWSGERRRRGHEAIARALPSSAMRRFLHLSAGLGDHAGTDELVELADEAIALTRHLARDGDINRAMTMLQAALSQLRHTSFNPDPLLVRAEERLLATMLDLALADGTPLVVGKVQYEIGRARAKTRIVAQLDQLVGASIAFSAGGDRALHLVEDMDPFDDLDLERRRQGVRALAARRHSPEIEDATIADVARWASRTGDPLTQARLALWEGFWHYRRGRYGHAARRHAEAAALDTWRLGRVSAHIAAASALMESFDLSEAARRAEGALDEARRCTSPYIEARAEWILRAVLYRQGTKCGTDLELVHAVGQLGARDLEATACLTEAAFAYRSRDHEHARALADRAASLWKFVNDLGPSMLARCLALATGSPPESAQELAELGNRARACRVRGVGIQALGLLARAASTVPDNVERDVPALVADIPRVFWSVPMDVLSVAEALEALAFRSPTDVERVTPLPRGSRRRGARGG